jgi:hypothetical protein
MIPAMNTRHWSLTFASTALGELSSQLGQPIVVNNRRRAGDSRGGRRRQGQRDYHRSRHR